MLRPMFGMGGTEILVILIVALLFLGPDKLPQAAKTISKGIRDIKKQSRVLQRTIEDDEHIGGAIRDLRSALRGEDEPYRPPRPQKELEAADPAAAEGGPANPAPLDALPEGEAGAASSEPSEGSGQTAGSVASMTQGGAQGTNGGPDAPGLTMPPTAGEPDADAPPPSASDDAELAALVKPAPNTIAHNPRPVGEPHPERKHG